MSISFSGSRVLNDGSPINPGSRAEGLMLNSRTVMAAVEDYDGNTGTWAYPGGGWSASRNLTEFIDAIPTYKSYGLNMVTVGMMGGHPRFGCSDTASGNFSMFTSDGSLRPDAKDRLTQLIAHADSADLIVNVQYFYRTANKQLSGESAVLRAVDQATAFLRSLNRDNILIEVMNESNEYHKHSVLRPSNIDQLISRIHNAWPGSLVSVSMHAGSVYPADLSRAVDWSSLHGNAISASKLSTVIGKYRQFGKPIAITEDKWDDGGRSLDAAVDAGAGWGYYDQGCEETGRYAGSQAFYSHGFQSLPVNWNVNTSRKQAFFGRVRVLTTAG